MSQTNKSESTHHVTVRVRLHQPRFVAVAKRYITPALAPVTRLVTRISQSRLRWHLLAAVAVFVIGTVYNLLYPFFDQNAYALDPKSAALLPDSSPTMANLVNYNMAQGMFNFDPSSLASASTNVLGQPTYSSAAFNQDPAKGMTVTDPTNKISFTMTPKFKLKSGRQDADRIVYPLDDGNGWAVYTLQGDGYKEDIILSYAPGDTVSYSYTLGLGSKLAAKLEGNGSLGIYGNTLLSGNVTTSSDKDAELLQKARDNAKKDTLLFTLPAPVVMGRNGPVDGISAKYTLKGDTLTVTTTGLKKGSYPLSIDPSIYVVTAQQFMQGNNETNINFDVNNKLIKKGRTTGARINSWTSSTALNSAVWGAQTAAAGGYAYQAGGTTGSGTSATVNWAQFNTSTGALDSPNPGTGACSGWCTNSAYNLPDGRANFSLVAYSGYLYAIGGTSANCTTGNGTGTSGYCKTVYIAKLGANGEPRLWHPTDTNPANWVYWYKDTNLPAERAYAGATVSNNTLYLLGGTTSSGATTAATIGAITPNGTIGSWTASGNTVPSGNAYDLTAQSYNGRLYVIGGSSSATSAPTNTTWYSKINTDGSINAWQQTTSFTTGRMSGGTDTSTIWGGYIYISGGCSAVNGSGYCTTIQSDMQVASINADGSLDNWYTVPNVTDTRFGHSLIGWRNTVYEIGGCSAQNTSTGACTTMLSTANYGAINLDGDASIVSTSATSGTAPCSGGTPYNCNVPSSAVGNTLNAVALVNGYLYIMGGCTNLACSSVSTGITYQAVGSDGTLRMPSTCSGSYTDSYCVSSVSLPAGLAAAGVAVFNNTIYLVGGFTTGTNIYNVATNADGSLGSFTTTSLSTVSSSAVTTLSYTYAYARANPSSAGSNPGNLYIIGGCTNAAVNCTGYSQTVLKCNIGTSGTPASCSTSGQLQLGSMPNSCGTGVGAMAGTVYANYIYLIGGASSSCNQMSTTIYAKIDNSNNIVATSGNAWTASSSTMSTSRQRGAGFGYNGYLYVVGGYDSGSGSVLTDIEFAKINTSDGSLGAWSVSTITIGQRWGVSVPVSNSFAYVIGGCTAGASPSSCSAQSQQIQTFQLYNNDSGAPAAYSTSANTFSTDPNRLGVGAAILNGYVYVAGGCTITTTSTPCTTESQDVSYASIDSYGNIGSWTSTSGTLPAARGWGKLEAVGGTLYYIGGQDTSGTAQSTVYYGTPSSGNVSTWNTATNGLPNARSSFGAAVWNDRLYIVGGSGTSGDCASGVCATVYVSPQQSSGGNITSSWSTGSTSFNVARRGAMAVAYANNLYVLGGTDGTNYFSDSQYSQISSSSGLAGNWSYAESMPQPVSGGDGFAANGYVYVVGGRSAASTCSPVTLVAPISANTTIASGNNPTGLGGWFQTNQKYSGQRYGNAALYNDGKAYLLGGMNCNTAGVSTYNTSGTYSYVVPAGTTSITVKAWGAGGGGGGGSGTVGGAGGGGGYSTSTITTTPGETLSLTVGGGGGGGTHLGSQNGGGGGGGYSSVFRSSTPLLIAAGGGGGGGTNASNTPGVGGAGGATTGSAGTTVSYITGGGGGTPSAGGTGSNGGNGWSGTAGGTGSSLTGGTGGGQASGSSGFASGGSPGGGGRGGGGYNFFTQQTGGGGGGGGGYFGGGGGGGSDNGTSGTGAGGGSSYLTGTGSSTSGGSGTTPGNSGDSSRGTAGNGGAGGTSAVGSAGNSGLLVITATAAITPVIQQTAVLSQPQIAQYSILMDTDSDVYPTNWLMNGVDNNIGARWILTYRSMTDPGASGPNGTGKNCSAAAMSNWGLTTTYNNVPLGIPKAYTAYDGSGTNTNCARYFFMNVSISAQQTFGYPDDVSRGPTITDLTLNFTAAPGKRLLHGRTFTGGLQMPNDTPYASQ